jgi:ABC-type lipoprotein release transport system permease subunit
MYVKLMLRGLLRHKKSGRRMILLLALCSTAIMFTLAFRDSFARQYRQLGIDAVTAHLQVVPADSPKNQSDSFNDHRQGLSLFAYGKDFRDFLGGVDGVEAAMPVIETGGTLFDLDGENTGYGFMLMGVEPEMLVRVLPAVRVREGKDSLAWADPGSEVPLFRPVPDVLTGEDTGNNDRFERASFRPEGDAWEAWKREVASRWPALFAPGAADGFKGAAGDAAFLEAMNRALERPDLLTAAPALAGAGYDWKVDDAAAALEAAEKMTPDSERIKHRQRVLRKKWFQAQMPREIRPIWDIVTLDTSYTMAVPPARGDDLLAMPAVVPVKTTAFVESMPLYFFTFYVDSKVMREYLAVAPGECTSLLIRLKDGTDPALVKSRIEAWIKEKGYTYKVKDAETLGQIFLSTAVAFDVIAWIIVALFVATVVVFIANAVSLALIKRRREIGTAIALGLSPGQNALVMFGEMAVLVCVAWAGGALLGTGVELLLAQIGLPGMIFFPGGVLRFIYTPLHALATLGIMLPVTLASTAFALRKALRLRAVDLLKE